MSSPFVEGGSDQDRVLTPIQRHGDIWLKRDDLFRVAGVCGGKARACWCLSQGAVGLVTGSVRVSPQQKIVSTIAEHLSIPCHIHTAMGEYTEEMLYAESHGAEITQHKMGFSNVLASRARSDANRLGWIYIPFGMECKRAVDCTRAQVGSIPSGVKRIVIVVGSGISAAGLLWGMLDLGCRIPVLGIRVGGGKGGRGVFRRLGVFAPKNWSMRMRVVQASVPYNKAVEASIGDVRLDPHYESKAAEFLEPGDLFWIVGHRDCHE